MPLGVIAAARARTAGPITPRTSSALLGQSAPTFFVGTLLLYLFAYRFGWFPIGGYGSGFWGRLSHLVLPAATLATFGVAYYARVVRSELVEALGEDYVRTARAKGLAGAHGARAPRAAQRARSTGHARRARSRRCCSAARSSPSTSSRGPGLGREVLQAILDVDLPLILGVVLVSAIAIAVANLLVDIVYLWIDPRLRG